MINPVSKAGSIFFLLNRSSPQMVKKRNRVVIQEKGITRNCKKTVYRTVVKKISNPAFMESSPSLDTDSSVTGEFFSEEIMTQMQQNMMTNAVAFGTGPEPSGSKVPGGKSQDSQRNTAQISIIRTETHTSNR